MTVGRGQKGQESWGQECWHRTAGTGQSGKYSREKTSGEDSQERITVTGKRQEDGQNMKRQNSWDRTTIAGQP